jgi:hypothetical protein
MSRSDVSGQCQEFRMTGAYDCSVNHALTLPVGRRALLGYGIRGAMGLYGLFNMGAAVGFASMLAGCLRAPGTSRDQFIYISEEKEIAMGVSAFHEVLRNARLSQNLEINEMVHRVGNRIAAAAAKP